MFFALVYKDDQVFVALTKEDSIKLLEQYLKERGTVKEAIEAIEFDLKKKTRYK